ncbi:MAG TPA: diphosphomevalonate decarboxylase [Alphaproteobacteria bacterium]|nr:diphosphomevalonate decarboxylase [Alphaproteobacteria bacterium]
MNAYEFVSSLLSSYSKPLNKMEGSAFAPTNIALVKYWGKRDVGLNLPLTSSFSVTLPTYGTQTKLSVSNEYGVAISNVPQPLDSEFSKRLLSFLDLFQLDKKFYIQTSSNIPIGAGLASSASGFAAIVEALNNLYEWNLSPLHKSLLARLGSGSACRSFYKGFVEWQKGSEPSGIDSFAKPYNQTFKELVIGIILVEAGPKPISSTKGMVLTSLTSPLLKAWEEIVDKDIASIKRAIDENNFKKLGKISQTNALTMHALMQTSYPPVYYTTPKTLEVIHTVLSLQEQGKDIYFTQDAGPNIKLLFQKKDLLLVQKTFQELLLSFPFD